MKNRFFSIILFIFIAITGHGCVFQIGLPDEGEKGSEIVIIDSLHRQIVFENFPERIIIAGLQTPMLINFFYMFPGAGKKLFAVENRVQSTKEFINILDKTIQNKMILEKGAGVEQISPLKPDLILMKDVMRDTVGLKLEETGFKVVYLNFETIERIQKDIQILGKVLNNISRADEINSMLSGKSDLINKVVDAKNSSPTVLLLQYSVQSDEPAFKIPPINWLQTEMVEKAGGSPVWVENENKAGWNVVSIEQIASWNPDFIFIIDYAGDPKSHIEELSGKPVWRDLTATKNGNLLAFPKDHLSWDQPDPRFVLGFSWLAHKLNPEALDLAITKEEIHDFYKFFFGIPEEIILEKIDPLIKLM